jgi:hypothetical protein
MRQGVLITIVRTVNDARTRVESNVLAAGEVTKMKMHTYNPRSSITARRRGGVSEPTRQLPTMNEIRTRRMLINCTRCDLRTPVGKESRRTYQISMTPTLQEYTDGRDKDGKARVNERNEVVRKALGNDGNGNGDNVQDLNQKKQTVRYLG